jgi:hypothetical protein
LQLWLVVGRLALRASKPKAVTATARKIAVLFYNTLRHGLAYRIREPNIMSNNIAAGSSPI